MLLPMLRGPGRDRHGRILRSIAELADAGRLRPLIDQSRFTLETAPDAHRRLESGKAGVDRRNLTFGLSAGIYCQVSAVQLRICPKSAVGNSDGNSVSRDHEMLKMIGVLQLIQFPPCRECGGQFRDRTLPPWEPVIAEPYQGPRTGSRLAIVALSYVDPSSDAQLLKVTRVCEGPVALLASRFGEHTQVLQEVNGLVSIVPSRAWRRARLTRTKVMHRKAH